MDDRRDPLEWLGQQLSRSVVQPLAADSGGPIRSERSQDLVARRDGLATRRQGRIVALPFDE